MLDFWVKQAVFGMISWEWSHRFQLFVVVRLWERARVVTGSEARRCKICLRRSRSPGSVWTLTDITGGNVHSNLSWVAVWYNESGWFIENKRCFSLLQLQVWSDYLEIEEIYRIFVQLLGWFKHFFGSANTISRSLCSLLLLCIKSWYINKVYCYLTS